jgi:hypothetical protein
MHFKIFTGSIAKLETVNFFTPCKNSSDLHLFFKRFDRGNCNCQGFVVPKAKREGRQEWRKSAVPRTIYTLNRENVNLKLTAYNSYKTYEYKL